jgi:hypothetical protein
MIREWWGREMDARRAISLAIEAVGLVLMILGLGAWYSDGHDFEWWAPLSVATGLAVGTFVQHRPSGRVRASLRALAAFAQLVLFFVAVVVTADAIGPGSSPMPDLLGVLALSGAALVAISQLLSERDPWKRRRLIRGYLALGLVVSGGVALVIGGSWTPLGLIALLVGVVACYLVAVRVRAERARDQASAPT